MTLSFRGLDREVATTIALFTIKIFISPSALYLTGEVLGQGERTARSICILLLVVGFVAAGAAEAIALVLFYL